MKPLNPAYSQVKGFPPVDPPHPDVYLRGDGLQGIRNRDQNDLDVQKRRRAAQKGDRFPLNDPDIGVGQLMTSIQNYDANTGEWDWIRAAAVCEAAVAAGNRIYLRPMTFVQGNFLKIPPGFSKVTGTIPGTSTTRIALNTMDAGTWSKVQEGYHSFKELVFDRFRDHIIALDVCLSCSIDGGQPSLRGHLGGSATIMDVFGITRERIIEELELQWRLFGLAGIGHISPNGSSVPIDHPASDHWLNKWFADKGYLARRQDSRPFRETHSTAIMADRAGWNVILDIYEITGGQLSGWTTPGGDWYSESPAGGPAFVDFYGRDYPANVQRAFMDVRNRRGFIWPMSSYPSKSQEPEYYSHYLEGPGGAFEFVPRQISDFIAKWRNVSPPPPPPPPPPPDTEVVEVPVTIQGGYIHKIEYGGQFPDRLPPRPDGDVHTLLVGVPIVNGERWNPRVHLSNEEGYGPGFWVNGEPPNDLDKLVGGTVHLAGRDSANVTFEGWEEPEPEPEPEPAEFVTREEFLQWANDLRDEIEQYRSNRDAEIAQLRGDHVTLRGDFEALKQKLRNV